MPISSFASCVLAFLLDGVRNGPRPTGLLATVDFAERDFKDGRFRTLLTRFRTPSSFLAKAAMFLAARFRLVTARPLKIWPSARAGLRFGGIANIT